jgi:FAD/FMN-containing dehydrogenase
LNKIAHYLQGHIAGEVTSNPDARRYFAHDASILEIVPTAIVYPRNENDVRKSIRFAWQLAGRGRKLPITPRGMGSGTSGSAIGSGIVLVFPAHMNKVVSLDTKKRTMSAQPGANFGALLQMLQTHGLFLPPYPASKDYATIGGAVANNAIGEKSVKYGAMADFVQSLRVVLSNGELIETGPLSQKELSHKMGLQTLEGEIYRLIDALLEENAHLLPVGRERLKARFSSIGYNIFDVKKNGQFDLTPLFTGSLGTLGVITEVTFRVAPHHPRTTQMLVSLEELEDLGDILPSLLDLKPSMADMLSRAAVQQILELNPNQLSDLSMPHEAFMHLFIEFDDSKEADRKKKVKHLQKIVDGLGAWSEVYEDLQSQERLRKLSGSVAILLQPQGPAVATPIAEDISVPVDKLADFLKKIQLVYREVGLPPALWGQAGIGVVRMWPALDLGQTGDRQKLFKIQGSLYAAAVRHGGSISASAGDGRVRAPYSPMVYGPEVHALMLSVKKIFDPRGILNPGVKTASTEEIKVLMRSSYSLSNFYDYLPRS